MNDYQKPVHWHSKITFSHAATNSRKRILPAGRDCHTFRTFRVTRKGAETGMSCSPILHLRFFRTSSPLLWRYHQDLIDAKNRSDCILSATAQIVINTQRRAMWSSIIGMISTMKTLASWSACRPGAYPTGLMVAYYRPTGTRFNSILLA